MTVSADITNTGVRAGEETTQLYVRLQGTSVAQPVRALSGFSAHFSCSRRDEKVTFQLGPEAFAFWNDQNKFAGEAAHVTLWIAPDSSQGLQTTLEITK